MAIDRGTVAVSSEQARLSRKGTIRLSALCIFFALGSFLWGYVVVLKEITEHSIAVLQLLMWLEQIQHWHSRIHLRESGIHQGVESPQRCTARLDYRHLLPRSVAFLRLHCQSSCRSTRSEVCHLHRSHHNMRWCSGADGRDWRDGVPIDDRWENHCGFGECDPFHGSTVVPEVRSPGLLSRFFPMTDLSQ